MYTQLKMLLAVSNKLKRLLINLQFKSIFKRGKNFVSSASSCLGRNDCSCFEFDLTIQIDIVK